MLLNHFESAGTKQFLFGESRGVNFLGLSAVGNAIKGVVDEVKGVSKETVAHAGWVRKSIGWLFEAKSAPGYILKSPFILSKKVVGAGIWAVKTVNDTSLALGTKMGAIIKQPLVSAVKETEAFSEEAIKAGYHLAGAPVLEALKSNAIDFPKRAIIDQFRTGIGMIVGVPSTFFSKAKDAIKETLLSPITLIKATRDAIKSVVWEMPKALLSQEFKKAGKSLLDAPVHLAKGIFKAPIAIASVPISTAMELGLGLTETAMNMGSAMAAPFEGMVNGYRAMGKSGKLLDYIKEKTAHGEVGSYRERFKDVFRTRSPFATMFAAA